MHLESCEPFGEFTYVGVTSLTLAKRLRQHVMDSRKRTSKVYQFMKEMGQEKFVMTLLEEFNETIEGESGLKELWWIMKLRAGLNSITPPGTTPFNGSNRFQNREAHNARSRAYYAANKESCNARNRAYHAANKELLNARSRAYNAANKGARRAYLKAYYLKNKDVILERQNEVVNCDCDKSYTRGNRSKHLRTWHNE